MKRCFASPIHIYALRDQLLRSQATAPGNPSFRGEGGAEARAGTGRHPAHRAAGFRTSATGSSLEAGLRGTFARPGEAPAPAGGSAPPRRSSALLAGALRAHGEPGAASPARRRKAQGEGAVCAGQARPARRRRGPAAAGARAAGRPHYLQHERAQVRGGSLQPAQRVWRRPVRAGEGRACAGATVRLLNQAGRPPSDACASPAPAREGRGLSRPAPSPCPVAEPCGALGGKCGLRALASGY